MSLLFCSICYVLCYLFQIVFLILEKKQKMVATLYLKGLASVTFVVLGAISFIQTDNLFFATFILVGLIFDALADVVFNLRFAFKKIERIGTIAGVYQHAVRSDACFGKAFLMGDDSPSEHFVSKHDLLPPGQYFPYCSTPAERCQPFRPKRDRTFLTVGGF